LAVEIKYWEKDTWINYIKNDVLPLYQSAATILNLWKSLRDFTHGKPLSEVIKEKPILEYVFVGGTKPPSEYEENGLAWIYKTLMGTEVNLREYYFLRKYDKEPKTLCTVRETEILRYVNHITVLLERAIECASNSKLILFTEIQEVQESVRRSVEEILGKPETLPERFVEFLNKALRLTIAYNECTRFIWHLRKIAKKYIKEYYPELLKPENFRFIQDLLGLREYIVPRVEDPEIAELFTIFSYDHAIEYSSETEIDGMRGCYVGYYLTGDLLPSNPPNEYPYNTLGGCICRVNELIWGLFEKRYTREDLVTVVKNEVPRPLMEWRIIVEEAIKASGCVSETIENLDNYEALSWLDDCLPSIFIGQRELIKVKNSKRLFLVKRW